MTRQFIVMTLDLIHLPYAACRGGAVQFLGTKRHHDKWLNATESFAIRGCFAMSELGHGSNVSLDFGILRLIFTLE